MNEIADLVTDAWCDMLVERQLLRLAAEHEPGDREFDFACRVAGQRLEARFRALDTKVQGYLVGRGRRT